MKLNRFGFASLTDAEGVDLMPRSSKCRALLVLLADTPEQKRSRRWLEAMLWPEREPHKASQNLRQAVYTLRDALPEGAVNSDRKAIWLTGIKIDTVAEERAASQGEVFLEGIDIDEGEFNDWLHHKRNGSATPRAPRPMDTPSTNIQKPQFLIRPSPSSTDTDSLFLCRAAADGVGALLSEFGDVEVYQPVDAPGRQTVQLEDTGLELELDVFPDALKGLSVRMALRRPLSGRVLWSHRARSDKLVGLDDPWIQEQVFSAADACFLAAAKSGDTAETRAETFAATAVRNLFRFSDTSHKIAEEQLNKAILATDSPHYHMWKTMVHQVQAIERFSDNWHNASDLAQTHIEQARALEGNSSMYSALYAQSSAMLTQDVDQAMVGAEMGVKRNPGNAFVYSGMASVLLRLGAFADARAAAEQGLRIVGTSSAMSPWWYILAGLAALGEDNVPVALDHFRRAHAIAPTFRAPLRHIVAIYLATGEIEQARRYLKRLQAEEKGFDPRQLVEDPAYPNYTLRNSPLGARLAQQFRDGVLSLLVR